MEACMAQMTDKHIRHLPVVERGEVIGVISIGDVVKTIIESQKSLIEGLENYIMGTEGPIIRFYSRAVRSSRKTVLLQTVRKFFRFGIRYPASLFPARRDMFSGRAGKIFFSETYLRKSRI